MPTASPTRATERQEGAATRRQLLDLGMSDAAIRRRVLTGRWQVLAPGVYATFSGPVPARTAVWGAVLRAGDGAAAGPRTTLWLVGAVDRPPVRFDVVVPRHRHVGRGASFRVLRRSRIEETVNSAASPPRLQVEEAVLEACAGSRRSSFVVDLVIRVVQRRLTTADRIAERLALRRSHPWRGLLTDVLADVRHGARSPLEVGWLDDVERAHGLPAGVVNRATIDEGQRIYRDVDYPEFGLVVELDGHEAHPVEEAFRDRRRDNRATVSGRRTLRYGWREIADDPCGVAAEVATVLHSLGWAGRLRPCGARCTATC